MFPYSKGNELTPWYIFNEWKGKLKDYIVMIMPHGFRFVFEAKRHNVKYFSYIFRGLFDINFKFAIWLIKDIFNRKTKFVIRYKHLIEETLIKK